MSDSLPRIIVGIDNGLSGALAMLNTATMADPVLVPMPIQALSKGRELDAQAVAVLLHQWSKLGHLTVILETPGKFSAGVKSISSMWDSYGATRAVCEILGLRHHRIAPQTWQKVMLPNCEKGQTKPFALAQAQRLWPKVEWREQLATKLAKNPHEGFIDAALIAEYARLRL